MDRLLAKEVHARVKQVLEEVAKEYNLFYTGGTVRYSKNGLHGSYGYQTEAGRKMEEETATQLIAQTGGLVIAENWLGRKFIFGTRWMMVKGFDRPGKVKNCVLLDYEGKQYKTSLKNLKLCKEKTEAAQEKSNGS